MCDVMGAAEVAVSDSTYNRRWCKCERTKKLSAITNIIL